MTTILIIAKWILIVGSAVALVFGIAFFLEIIFGNSTKSYRVDRPKKVKKSKKNKKLSESNSEAVITKITTVEKTTEKTTAPEKKSETAENAVDLDEMLARLEAKASAVSTEEVVEEKKEKAVIEEKKEETQEESLEEIRKRALEKIEQRRRDAMLAESKEENEKSSKEIIKESLTVTSVIEKSAKEVNKDQEPTEVVKVVTAPDALVIDYESRLATLKENYAKVERDFNKNHNSVLKYERTNRRKIRNEKLLNKKSAELTNLNLVLYNVKDLKSIDPDKKAKQEELSSHIKDLKDSIRVADKYVTDNASKYENAKKFDAFLDKEKQRYEIEIKELEELIKKGKKN